MVGKLGKNAAVAAGSRHYACLFMLSPVDVPMLNPAERHRVSGANCRSARLDPPFLDRPERPLDVTLQILGDDRFLAVSRAAEDKQKAVG